LLLDVLQSAREIGGGSQLIIEIKPGNSDAATALARMFLRYPELMASCAVVMSFDVFAMHNLRGEMVTVLDALQQQEPGLSKVTSIPTSMSFGNFSVAQNMTPSRGMTIGDSQQRRVDSSDNVGMWLSESVNRSDSFNFTPFHSTLPAGSVKRKPSIDKYISTSPNLRRRPSIDRSRGSLVSQFGAPKLMLLTVADPPKIPCELWVDVADLSPVDEWLNADDGSLDGVYLQFQKPMMTPDGAKHLRALADKCCVGVWGHNGRDPDDWDTFHWLVRECRVSYVNSDLPKGFKKVLRTATSAFPSAHYCI
jgi:hypothetical protein